jgi:hypothetical protein
MPFDFHALNERIARLPLPERSMAQFIADTYRAQSCFEDHERTLVALASETDDPHQRAAMTLLAIFARQMGTSAASGRANLWNEMCGGAIIEGNPDPSVDDCSSAPDKEAAK